MGKLKELVQLDKMLRNHHHLIHEEKLAVIEYRNNKFPIKAITIGNREEPVPTLGLFGGVHGLERVGSHVALSFLKHIIEQLHWNKDLEELLGKIKIIMIPIVNPVGMKYLKRSNGNGVDLMRNAPVDADEGAIPILGGHRLSDKLPWYRGEVGKIEKEAQVLIDFVKRECRKSPCSICLDLHSGFGMIDRIWYPYAKSKEVFSEEEKVKKLFEIFDSTIPHHIYKIEPQSDSYTTHGDLWDYIFDEVTNIEDFNGTFIPLTLEMGSWNWLKKNPIQVFNKLGLFNPIKDHRFDRTMRRHFLLLDFLLKAVKNNESWRHK